MTGQRVAHGNWYCPYDHPTGTTCPACHHRVIIIAVDPEQPRHRLVCVPRNHVAAAVREARGWGWTVLGVAKRKRTSA